MARLPRLWCWGRQPSCRSVAPYLRVRIRSLIPCMAGAITSLVTSALARPDNNTGPDTCGPFQPCSWTPEQMSLPAGVTGTAIAAGQDTSYAIGSDRNLSASGENEVGQLGDGTDTGPDVCTQPLGLPNEPCSTVPVRVSLPSGVTLTAIAAGYESGYATGSDSHLYAWGANSDGELGDGTTTNADTPVQVSL